MADSESNFDSIDSFSLSRTGCGFIHVHVASSWNQRIISDSCFLPQRPTSDTLISLLCVLCYVILLILHTACSFLLISSSPSSYNHHHHHQQQVPPVLLLLLLLFPVSAMTEGGDGGLQPQYPDDGDGEGEDEDEVQFVA